MNETELEKILVRLVGDGSQYQQMMQTAAKSTTDAAGIIQHAGEQIEGIKLKIEGFGQAALGFLGGYGLATSLSGAFQAFEQAEVRTIRMNAALKANGRDVEATTAEYKQFATNLEKVSTSSVASTMDLLRQAESFGLTGTKAENAAKNAVYFASAIDGNSESAGMYLRVTRALEEGNIKQAMQFSRMIPQLRGVRDETEFLTKANKLLGIGQETSSELANTAGNQLERLSRAFKGVTVEIGRMVADFIGPFLKIATGLVEQFNALDPSIKRVVAGVVLLTLALFALPPILVLIWKLVGLATGGISILTGLLAVGLVSAAGVLAVIVERFGGVGKVMDWIKERAVAAWEWLKPVRQAVASFWQSLVEKAREAWGWIEAKAVEVWNNIKIIIVNAFAAMGINLNNFRDQLRDAFIFAEFTVRNFGLVWQWVWAGVKLKSLSFFEDFKFFFSDVMPALLKWLSQNWITIFVGALALIGFAVVKIFDAIPWSAMWEKFKEAASSVWAWYLKNWKDVSLAVASPAGFLAKKLYEEYTKPGGGGVQQAVDQFVDAAKKQLDNIKAGKLEFTELVLPQRQLTNLEQQWKGEYERLGAAVAVSFAEFRDKKLREFAAEHPEVVKKAGEAVGSNFAGGVGKGLDKLESVLRHSADAFAHYTDYRSRLTDSLTKALQVALPGGAAGAGQPAGAAPVPAQPVVVPPAPAVNREQLDGDKRREQLLRNIWQVLAQTAQKQGIAVQPLNLGGLGGVGA